jgi:hypothetical protein
MAALVLASRAVHPGRLPQRSPSLVAPGRKISLRLVTSLPGNLDNLGAAGRCSPHAIAQARP